MSQLIILFFKTRINSRYVFRNTLPCEVFRSPSRNLPTKSSRLPVPEGFWDLSDRHCRAISLGSFLESVLYYPRQQCLLCNIIKANQKPRPPIFPFLPDFLA